MVGVSELTNQPTVQPQPVPATPPQKTNIWMILSIILMTAIVVGAAVYFWQNASKKETSVEIPAETVQPQFSPLVAASPNPTPLVKPTLTSIDDLWNKYTNPALSFSLKVLKNMVEPYGQCNYSNQNGDHSYRPKEASVPVKIFEEENNVYLAAEYFYKLTGETKENNRSYFSGCDKVINSAATVKDMKTYFSPSWRIVIKPIANDSELDKFLKDRYGQGCSLGEKKAAGQNGVFDIKIKGDGKEPPESKCFINYMTVVKYYPAKRKVAAWDIGQACSFYYPTIETCHDTEMTDSFTFE